MNAFHVVLLPKMCDLNLILKKHPMSPHDGSLSTAGQCYSILSKTSMRKKKTKNKTTIGYTLLNKCETQVMANPRLDPQPEKEPSRNIYEM